MTRVRPGGLALLLTTTWDLPLNVGKGVITQFILAPGEVARGLDGRWMVNNRSIPLWFITGDIWQSNTSGEVWYGFALVDEASLLPIDGETFDEDFGIYNSGRMVVVRKMPQEPRRMLPMPKGSKLRSRRPRRGKGPFGRGGRPNPSE